VTRTLGVDPDPRAFSATGSPTGDGAAKERGRDAGAFFHHRGPERDELGPGQRNRIVCLTPVRNEAWLLDKFLTCASLWADEIVVGDQCSSDGSRAISRRFPKVTLVENDSPVYDEPRQRRLLLEAGRRLPGRKTFVVLDADEFLSANFNASEEWRLLATAAPGTTFRFNWANILPGFRRCWVIGNLPAAFVDDGRPFFGLPLHGPRLPPPESGRCVDLREIKILHYQYTDWARMKSKQCWYQCYEYVLAPEKSAVAVYRNYHRMDLFARREKLTRPLPAEWLSWYEQQGVVMKEVGRSDSWWDEDVVRMMLQFGPAHFRRAAIWSRDWNRVRERFFPDHTQSLDDPRGIGLKLLHACLRLSQPWSRAWMVRTADRVLRRAGC
jgi:hypothetical protein